MRHIIILLLTLLYHTPLMAEDSKLTIAVSIKPLHSLVSTIAGDNADVRLLLTKQSPHDAIMKPSHIKLLQQSDVIFYISDDFENFIMRALASLPDKNSKYAYGMTQDASLRLLSYDEKPHDEDDGHNGHSHNGAHTSGIDPHLWLSPHNAQQMVRFISQKLQTHAPKDRAIYQRNEAALLTKLQALDNELAQILQPVKHKPYIVLHNSYQYFQTHYGLAQPVIITNYPEHGASAKQIIALNKHVKAMAQQQQISCIFHEAEFDTQIGNALNQQQDIRIIPLPLIGYDIAAGAQHYFMLMHKVANDFKDCLSY